MTLTIIMTVKYCFAIATTFTTPQSRQKINLFSFQHYLHYTITIRKILQYFLPQEVHCFWKICTWYSSFTVRTFSELWVFFFLRNFNAFTSFVHDAMVSPPITSVESYIFYYPITMHMKVRKHLENISFCFTYSNAIFLFSDK